MSWSGCRGVVSAVVAGGVVFVGGSRGAAEKGCCRRCAGSLGVEAGTFGVLLVAMVLLVVGLPFLGCGECSFALSAFEAVAIRRFVVSIAVGAGELVDWCGCCGAGAGDTNVGGGSGAVIVARSGVVAVHSVVVGAELVVVLIVAGVAVLGGSGGYSC